MYFTRLIAALFVIAKICKNFVAPHLENEFRKIWFIYNMEYYTAIKRVLSWDLFCLYWQGEVTAVKEQIMGREPQVPLLIGKGVSFSNLVV